MEIAKLKPVSKPKKLPKWYYFLFFPSMMVYAYIMRQVLGLIWGNIFLVYGLVPLMDQLISHDCANPTLDEIK
jgi:alkane 1-monooxygenase